MLPSLLLQWYIMSIMVAAIDFHLSGNMAVATVVSFAAVVSVFTTVLIMAAAVIVFVSMIVVMVFVAVR